MCLSDYINFIFLSFVFWISSIEYGGVNIFTRISAGITTGACAVLTAQPTDVVKIRLQAQGNAVLNGAPKRYTGAINAYQTIAKEEGVRGLWKGKLEGSEILPFRWEQKIGGKGQWKLKRKLIKNTKVMYFLRWNTNRHLCHVSCKVSYHLHRSKMLQKCIYPFSKKIFNHTFTINILYTFLYNPCMEQFYSFINNKENESLRNFLYRANGRGAGKIRHTVAN